jgi:hypothetical protein
MRKHLELIEEKIAELQASKANYSIGFTKVDMMLNDIKKFLSANGIEEVRVLSAYKTGLGINDAWSDDDKLTVNIVGTKERSFKLYLSEALAKNKCDKMEAKFEAQFNCNACVRKYNFMNDRAERPFEMTFWVKIK